MSLVEVIAHKLYNFAFSFVSFFVCVFLTRPLELKPFNRISRVELNGSLNNGVNVGFWDRPKHGCITNFTVQSDQLGLVQKTYTVADVPVHVVPLTVRLRYGNFDRCVWFSMLKSTGHGFVPVSVPGGISSDVVTVSVSFRQITNFMPVRPDQWEKNATFETVCRNKSQAMAFGNMTCDEVCEQEPRCVVAEELKSHCCFAWLRALQSEKVCKLENAEVPLVDRLLPGRSVEGITLQGSAQMVRGVGEAHMVHNSSTDRSTIEWTFHLNSSTFGDDYFLHLNQLGAEAREKFGALLNPRVGTPKMQGAMAVLEANEQEDVDVSVESDGDQNQIIHLRPNENFSFLNSGISRKLHVVPLIFGCI